MEETKSLALTPVLDNSTGKYVVENFNEAKEIVRDFIEKETSHIEVNDDMSLAVAKKTRTDIRKKKDAITEARLNINALLLGEFNAQLKEIEGMLNEADDCLKTKINTYTLTTRGNVNGRIPLTTLVVKGYDAKAIEKVKALALKLGLSAEVK